MALNHPVGSAERGAYFYFDLLRAVAASLVVLEHLRDLFWLPAAQAGHLSPPFKLVYFLTGFGSEAVTAFFVLSGFWITKTVERRKNTHGFWRSYLFDRLSRLWIVIIPALALGGLLDCIGRFGIDAPLYRGTTGTIVLDYDVASHLSLATLLGNAAFLQTIVVPTFGSNGPFWSLANEFWYYVWFPALLLLVHKRRPSPAIAALAVAAIAPHLIAGFVIWLFGSALSYLDRAASGRWSTPWLLVGPGIFLGCAMTASRLNYIDGDIGTLTVGSAFAVFAWSLLKVDPRPLKGAALLSRYGARASFSLYAAHFPVLALLAAVLLHGTRMMPSLAGLLGLAAVFGLTLVWGWLFSCLTESQTDRLRSLFGPRSRRAPVMAEEVSP